MGISCSSGRRLWLVFFAFTVQSVFLFGAGSTPESFPEPTITSIFPLGAQQGAEINLEITGKALDGSYAVLFNSGAIMAQVRDIEKIESQLDASDYLSRKTPSKEEKKPPVFRVSVRAIIDPSTPVGVYSLRLISPRGLSNSFRFRVDEHIVSREVDRPHSRVREAQQITVPAILNGTVTQHGELDYYVFDAVRVQKLAFEIVLAEDAASWQLGQTPKFRPRIALYQPTGSWLDPDRPTRILFDEEKETVLMPLRTRFSYQVEPGRYLVEVSSLFGKGGIDNTYQLRILPADISDDLPPEVKWQERTFFRKIEPGLIQDLWARTVRSKTPSSNVAELLLPDGSLDNRLDSNQSVTTQVPVELFLQKEKEPNDLPKQALNFDVGTMIDGIISTPADRDTFQFDAKAGQKLVFELFTPKVGPPHFNPVLELRSEEGEELLNNIHMRKTKFGASGGASSYLKAVEPKVIYSVERDGRYHIQIRDVTSRYGNADYAYKLVVRNQVPHVGSFEVKPHDRINLIPGQARKLNIVTYQEEGFSGDVLFTFSGLPPGVSISPGAEIEPKKKAYSQTSDKEESFVSAKQNTTLILFAELDAPLTRNPLWIGLRARPVVEQEIGLELPVAEIPLMVVRPESVHLSSQ